MSGLRGSPGFIWDIKRQLGQGATSMVCAGRNKHTGEQVAVKVFNQAGTTRPSNVKNREFEVLRKLNHDNIVRMIACEAEQSSSNLVIVMELCTGGSLYTILEDPKNAFGVEEEEFLLILEHVASGMKHLRENGIVHRDIKPGNIMRYIAEDGRSIYKLTDFGAARELDEQGEFMSLYGTEEYLHPDMYERAVLRGSQYKVFGATVDLWSLGVTFYHVLTGQLPFRPFGGRRNKETMHMITTQKETGVISGVQETEDGQIDWNRQLPQSCRISQGLHFLVTPFLAGLLEADQRKTWQFDKFFIEARKITSKKILPMFSPATWQLLNIYADPTDTLSRLQELVAQQTEFPAASQLLLYQNNLLSELVDLDKPVANYPKCISRQKPIFIFPSADISFMFPVPSLTSFPRFTTTMNLDNDYPLAKMCVGILHAFHREISDSVLRQQLAHDSVICYRNQLYHFLEHLRDYRFHLSSLCTETSKRKEDLVVYVRDKIQLLEILSKEFSDDIIPLLQELRTKWTKHRHKFEELEEKMNHGLTKIEKCIAKFTKELDEKHLVKDWDFKQGCSPGQRCAPKLEMSIKTASSIMDRFKLDKKRGSLPYNDEQIHKFEKNNLYSLTVKAQNTIREHCVQNSQRLSALLCTWLRQGNALRRESLDVEREMTELTFDQQNLTTKLDQDGRKMVSDLVSKTIEKYNSDGFQRKHKELPFRPLTQSINGMTSINGSLKTALLNIKDQDFVLKNMLLERVDKLSISDLESLSKEQVPEDSSLVRVGIWIQLSSRCQLAMPLLKHMINQRDRQHAEDEDVLGNDGQQFPSSYCDIGCSPLHHEVKDNDVEGVRTFILSYPNKSSQTNRNGLSPLHLSCFIGNLDVTKLLLEWDKAAVEIKDHIGLSPLHWAVWAGHSQVVKLLLTCERCLIHDHPRITTPLHLAAAKGNTEILEMLAERSDDIDAQNANLRTPLHLAVMKRFPKIVKCLLALGADPSSRDKTHFSALHYAARLGREEIVEMLLESGKINRALTRSAGQEFVIFPAIKSGSVKVVNMLIKVKVDLTELDNEKRGVLHLACIHGDQDMVECFLPLIGTGINRGDKYGWTALHYAAKFQTKLTLRLLVNSGADLEACNHEKQTPLHIAALAGSPNARVLIELDQKVEPPNG